MILPLDIFREILLRLPAESLFRFRAVCKRWRTVIDDPSFARAHTIDQLSSSSLTLVTRNSLGHPSCDQLHTFDLDAVKAISDYSLGIQAICGYSLNLTYNESCSLHPRFLVSACNGLFLVAPENPFHNPPLEIWNLSTHERLQLPQIDFSHSGPVFVGLGYDHAAQDFKAVAMHSQLTHVYSLRSDTWTTNNRVCLGSDKNDYWAMEENGLFLCGALHWLFFDKIIVLDLGTEKYRHIQLNALQKSFCLKHIDVLGGCLVVSGYSDDSQFFDVWVMKNYGSDDESWTKLFRVDLTDVYFTYLRPYAYVTDLRPVAYMKDKNQVLLRDGKSGFFLFNVRRGSMKMVYIHGLNGDSHAQIIPRTIFRLRDHCGGSGTSRIVPLCRPRKMIKATLTIYPKHY